MAETKINVTLDERQVEILTRMLGAGPDVPKKSHGYRNRYCAVVGQEPHAQLLRLIDTGLVEAGPKINEGRDQLFYATYAGCQAIGLGPKAIERAMAD